MSLLDVLRSGVAIADSITKDLQSSVDYKRWKSDDGAGTILYNNATTLLAVVDTSVRANRGQYGIVNMSKPTVTFLNIAALMAATDNLGLSTRDRIVLPGGREVPIESIGGFMDPGTGVPIATEAYLG